MPSASTNPSDDLMFQRMSVEEALAKRPGFRPGEDVSVKGFGGQTVEELQSIINDPASSPGAVETARTRLAAAQGIESMLQGTSNVLEAAPGAAYDLARPTLDMGADALALTGRVANLGAEGVGRAAALIDPGLGESILGYTEDRKGTYDRLATMFEEPPEADLRDDAKAARGFGRIDDTLAVDEGTTPVVEPVMADTENVDTLEQDTPIDGAPAPDAGTGTGTLKVDPERLDSLMPGPDDTEDDIRSKYKDRLALLQEVLGEDEAGARNKGMDLAMIGLAIMSGQSPNALTNIAQGGLAGMQAISARDEAERDRQRLIRTTAIEGVLAEEAAGTAAAASAAEKEADRLNAIRVAEIRNSNALDTKTGEVTYRSLFQEAYKVATDILNMPAEVRSGAISPTEYADRVAKAGLAGSRGGATTPAIPRVPQTQEQVQAAVQARVDAAKDDPAALAAIRQSLVNRGMDPSTYGIK